MYLLLLLLWILLNGKITFEIIILGLIISSAIYYMMCKFLEYSPESDRILIKNSWNIFYYIGVLFIEILRSGIAVLHFVLSRNIHIEPQIVIFPVALKNDFLKTILANSISLTPGTITLHVEGDLFYVHALDYTLAEDIENSIFHQILQKMEKNMEATTHD